MLAPSTHLLPVLHELQKACSSQSHKSSVVRAKSLGKSRERLAGVVELKLSTQIDGSCATASHAQTMAYDVLASSPSHAAPQYLKKLLPLPTVSEWLHQA